MLTFKYFLEQENGTRKQNIIGKWEAAKKVYIEKEYE